MLKGTERKGEEGEAIGRWGGRNRRATTLDTEEAVHKAGQRQHLHKSVAGVAEGSGLMVGASVAEYFCFPLLF